MTDKPSTISVVTDCDFKNSELTTTEIPVSELGSLEKVKEALELAPQNKVSMGFKLSEEEAIDESYFTIDSLPCGLKNFQQEMLDKLKKKDSHMFVCESPTGRDSVIHHLLTRKALDQGAHLIVEPKRKYEGIRISPERDYEELNLLAELLGYMKEPTHTRIVKGVVEHYFLLQPTMLSVQIALLCGFELKQTIERVTHRAGKPVDAPELAMYDEKPQRINGRLAFDEFTTFAGFHR